MIRTFDEALIKRIITDPSIYPFVSDSSCPAAEDFEPPMHIVWLLVSESEGLWAFQPESNGTYRIHANLLPHGRGKRAMASLKQAIRWMAKNTDCELITAFIDDDKPHVAMLARRAGFTFHGWRNGRQYFTKEAAA